MEVVHIFSIFQTIWSILKISVCARPSIFLHEQHLWKEEIRVLATMIGAVWGFKPAREITIQHSSEKFDAPSGTKFLTDTTESF